VNKTQKSALKWAITACGIEEINEKTMAEVDAWFVKLLDRDEEALKKVNMKESSLKTVIKSARKMFEDLSQYSFTAKTGGKRLRKDFTKLPPNIELMCKDKADLEKVFLDFKDYMTGRRRSKEYVYNCVIALKSLIEFSSQEKFIDKSISRGELVQAIQCVEEKDSLQTVYRNQRTNEEDLRGMSLRCIIVVNNLIDSWTYPNLKNQKHVNVSEIKPAQKEVKIIERDYFTNEEVEKLEKSFKNNRERLVFTIFLTTGMRAGALRVLRVNEAFDDKMDVLPVGKAKEKLGRTRTFYMSEKLKKALLDYKESYLHLLQQPDNFIFPCQFRASNKRSCSIEGITKMVKEVCDRAGVSGDYVHTHAFRKTVVNNMVNSGNTIERASHFIGNATTMATDKHYWKHKNNLNEDIGDLMGPIIERRDERSKMTALLRRALSIMNKDMVDQFILESKDDFFDRRIKKVATDAQRAKTLSERLDREEVITE
jgi:integrase